MEAVWVVAMVSVPRVCSIPLGHPVAWDLCQQQTLFDIIFALSASFPLVEVNSFIMTAMRSMSISSLGIFSGARLARFPKREAVPVDVVDDGVGGLLVGVEEVEHWGVEKPWKLRMMGTRPALQIK